MNAGSIDEVAEIIERRGWDLKEKKEDSGRRRKTAYETALENLDDPEPEKESDMFYTDPMEVIKAIVMLQNHIDARFASRNGFVGSAVYKAGEAVDWIKRRNSLSAQLWRVYSRSDVEIIREQRLLTRKLLSTLEDSREDIGRSYDLLEGYRLEYARDLDAGRKEYLRVERAIEELERDGRVMREKMKELTAESDRYSQMIHAAGNLRLERQRLVNEHEKIANGIRGSKIGLEGIADYQLVIRESDQVLGDANSCLEQVSVQQAIAQAVLSAFVKGEASMRAAYQVMEALSGNIAVTHKTIKGAFNSLNSLAVQLSTGRASADAATSSSKTLYGSLRSSRVNLTQNVHEYVRDMFEKPAVGRD